MNRYLSGRVLVKAGDLLLAGIFAVAAAFKLPDRVGFEQAIAGFQLVPEPWLAPMAVGLPVFELSWAALLAFGVQRLMGSIALMSLLGVFTLASASAVARDIDTQCGCFGGDGGSAIFTIMRNLGLFAGVVTLWTIGSWRADDPVRHQHATPASPILMPFTAVLAAIVASGFSGSFAIANDKPDNVSPPASEIPALDAALEAGGRYRRLYEPMRDWRGEVMSYWVNLPENFDVERTYPILLEWHGSGGGPKTRLFPDIYQVDEHIHVGLTYPDGSRGGAILYPTDAYVAFMRHVYDDVTANFRGNGDYVFIGGFSAGGFMATGPGIALMIRAGLRDALAGVLAGGCSWMSDPRYTRNVHVLLWYGEHDVNSNDLPRRLPELEEHAAGLTVIFKPGAGHSVNNTIEGPAIRRFLRLQGPHARVYGQLYHAAADYEESKSAEARGICHEIARTEGPGSAYAQILLDRFDARSGTGADGELIPLYQKADHP